jgi:hypothetical protein
MSIAEISIIVISPPIFLDVSVNVDAESKKGKEPRNQVPRKVWESEEGSGPIFYINLALAF